MLRAIWQSRRAAFAGLLSLSFVLGGCSSKTTAPAIEVEVSPLVGEAPFELGKSFKTAAGEDFTPSRLRFYLSGFRLRRGNGSWYAATVDPQTDAGYYLVDAAVTDSLHFKLPAAPSGDYTGVEFRLGIDTARNHAGAQTGVLAPERGMFWMWNTGYTFFKLEGRSPASPEDEGRVTLHVGGDDGARTVYLPLGAKPAHVAPGIQSEIHLAVDLGAFFGGEPALKFGATHSVMEAKDAGPIADRAARIFRVEHVHNEPVAAGS